MNHTPFDRDDITRDSERNWQARAVRERLERRGDVDYAALAKGECDNWVKEKAAAEARRKFKPKEEQP